MIKILLALSFFLTGEIHAQQNYNKLNVKELDVTSRVNVTSTTKSSKPCPVMTLVQRDAIATPLTGSCVYNSTDLQLNIYDGSLWQSAGGGGIENWETATAYDVDDVVIESNKIYQCEIAHTSGTFATDLSGGNWVELSAQGNLTGVISSTGLATTITSQTGTGSTFVVQNTPTLTTPNIGAATGTSLTLSGNISAYNYDKDNLLINGNIENPLSTEWTCTVGTCTRTTTSGEFSKDTAALKVALSAQAMNVSQTVTTPSGIQKQGYARVIYRVPATMADFQICTLVDAAEQTCVPTANLIKDDTFRSIEIPLTFGTTSAGIKFKTTSSYTANAYFDGVILAQGLGLQNLQGDTVYSAQVSSTGVVSGENTDFINGNCTNANPFVCTFVVGRFTATPNCNVTFAQNVLGSTYPSVQITAQSATSISIGTSENPSGSVQRPFVITCQKSGNDYLASSSNVYSQASANYDWTAFTPTLSAGFGSPSLTNVCRKKREAGDMLISCSFATGTTAGSLATMTIPDSLSIDTTKIIATNTTAGSGQLVGYVNQSTAGHMHPIITATGTSTTLLYFGDGISSTTLVAANGNVMSSSTTSIFNIRIPISGWSNSNVIVGSFENVPTVPGAGARIDIFSVAYGNSLNTACTSSNGVVCPYIKTIGAGASITHGATAGAYNLIAPRTYIELQCLSGTEINNHVSTSMSCSNCNGHAFVVTNALTANGTNAYGNVSCIGTY